MIRVAHFDDHYAMRLGVATYLRGASDIRMVCSAASVRDVDLTPGTIDLALLDLRLADGSRVGENVEALRAVGAHVVALTSGDFPELVRGALASGVVAVVNKLADPSELLETIRAIARGDDHPASPHTRGPDDHRTYNPGLSPREREVLELYASGMSAAEVAQDLFLSRETVLMHIKRIRIRYRDVGRDAPSKIDLRRRAIEDGLLPPD